MMSISTKKYRFWTNRPTPRPRFYPALPLPVLLARIIHATFRRFDALLKKVSFDLDARVPYQIEVIVNLSLHPPRVKLTNNAPRVGFFPSRRTLVHDATRLYSTREFPRRK